MLTYFAKYVNLNGKVSQHTFFRHFSCFLGKPIKILHSAEKYLSFSSLSIRKGRNLFNQQNPYSIFPFQDYQLTRPS